MNDENDKEDPYALLRLVARQQEERRKRATQALAKEISSTTLPIPDDLIEEAYHSASLKVFDSHPGFPEFIHRQAFERAETSLLHSIDELLVLSLKIADQPAAAYYRDGKTRSNRELEDRFSLIFFAFCHCVSSVGEISHSLIDFICKKSDRKSAPSIEEEILMQIFFSSFRNLSHHVSRSKPNLGFTRSFSRKFEMVTLNLSLSEVKSIVLNAGKNLRVDRKTANALMASTRNLPESIDLVDAVKGYLQDYLIYSATFNSFIADRKSAELNDYLRCKERFERFARYSTLRVLRGTSAKSRLSRGVDREK